MRPGRSSRAKDVADDNELLEETAMKHIYVSSTFADLRQYREAVSRTIQMMGHQESSLKDSLESDDRPIDVSLSAVDESDIYVGIFAWRYGHIPSAENPGSRSITELECHRALERGIPCLVFLLDVDAPWLPKWMDLVTGDGESGARIRELREFLSKTRFCGTFRSPEELAKRVSIDVQRVVEELNQQASEAKLLTEKSKVKVFLCHASQDKAAVRTLRERLLGDGYSPWLDENEILPGQDWRLAISHALSEAHIVVACLSKASTTKIGFIQKEIKDVLDLADLRPGGAVFIIPLKLEECEVPERLARWQWVDYFGSEGYGRLRQSLEMCIAQNRT